MGRGLGCSRSWDEQSRERGPAREGTLEESDDVSLAPPRRHPSLAAFAKIKIKIRDP